MRRFFSFFAIGLLAALTFNCKKDDEAPSNRFTFIVDGVEQKIQSVSGEYREEAGAQAIMVAALTDQNVLVQVITTQETFNNPPPGGVTAQPYQSFQDCQTVDGTVWCDGSAVFMITDDDLFVVDEIDERIIVTITKCDPGRRLISGNFSCDLMDTDLQVIPVSGTFENVRY